MRLRSCTFHNFGPFGDFKLDLEALDPAAKFVALVAPNGAGKTFCVETAMAGACYRKMPTNGSLVKRATARDSWVESRVHFGQDLKIKHLVDSGTGDSAVLVTNDNDQPLLPTTSVAKFDVWAKRFLPDPDVFFSSIFAAQQSEGFVKMGSAERIDVILRVIGVARIERMAKAARARRDKASTDLQALLGRTTDARGDVPTVEAAEQALAAAIDADELQGRLLRKARQDLESVEAEARRVEEEAKRAAELAAKRTTAVAALAAQRDALAKLEERLKNNRAVLEQSDSIRAARAELDVLAELDASLALDLADIGKPFDQAAGVIAAELAEQRQAAARAEADVRAAKGGLDAANAAVRAAADRVKRAGERLVDEAKVAESVEALAGSLAAVEGCQANVSRLESTLQSLRDQRLASAGERIDALRGGLARIETELDDGSEATLLGSIASNTLGNDDASIALANGLPALVSKGTEAVAEAKAALGVLEQSHARHERLAARAPEMVAARAELAAALDAEQTAAAATEDAQAQHADASIDLDIERTTLGDIEARKATEAARRAELEPPAKAAIVANQQAAAARRAVLVPFAAKYDHLVAADARIAELEPQLAPARAEFVRLESEVASAAPASELPSPAPDVAAFKKSSEDFERASKAAHGAVAVAQQKLTDAQAVDGRLASLESERAQLEADLADWTRLSLDLGRTGLQSAEVDSAGPELTELVNDLLRNCHGPRFTVSVETQRVDSTGHKLVDECRIQVIDTVRGTEKEIREHSGGERALLGEAVGLALTMLACRRAGFERPTLIRDESASACDPENARAWVSMCRRAIEFTGADRMIFISHSDEVVAMADARIELPTFQEAS